MAPTIRTCAICAASCDGSITAPIGKDDAPVFVCAECNNETPIARDSERGYEPPPENEDGGFLDAITRGAERAIPGYREKAAAAKRLFIGPMYTGVAAGYEVVRVPRSDGQGGRRDNRAAYEYARKHFGPEVEAVGTSARFFVFQRPSPERLAKARKQRDDHRDPIAALTRLALKR